MGYNEAADTTIKTGWWASLNFTTKKIWLQVVIPWSWQSILTFLNHSSPIHKTGMIIPHWGLWELNEVMHKEEINNSVWNNIYRLPAYLQHQSAIIVAFFLSQQLSTITYTLFLLVQENMANE